MSGGNGANHVPPLLELLEEAELRVEDARALEVSYRRHSQEWAAALSREDAAAYGRPAAAPTGRPAA